MDILNRHLDPFKPEGSDHIPMANSGEFPRMARHDFEDRLDKHGVCKPTTSREHYAGSGIVYDSYGTGAGGIEGFFPTVAGDSQYGHGVLDGMGDKASTIEDTPIGTSLVSEPMAKGDGAGGFSGPGVYAPEIARKEMQNPFNSSLEQEQHHAQPAYDPNHGGHYGASAMLAAQGYSPTPESYTGAWANVNHGLHDSYKDILTTYWQNTIKHLESETHDYKIHDLPLARIKKVMNADPDPEVKLISAEAPILFAKGCDIFITELTMRAWIHAEENKRRTLQRADIASALAKSDMFDFLIDIVPREQTSYAQRGYKKAFPKEGLNASDIGKQNPYGYPSPDVKILGSSGEGWGHNRDYLGQFGVGGHRKVMIPNIHCPGWGYEKAFELFHKGWDYDDDSRLNHGGYTKVKMPKLDRFGSIYETDNLHHKGWDDDYQVKEANRVKGRSMMPEVNSHGWVNEIAKLCREIQNIWTIVACPKKWNSLVYVSGYWGN